MVLFAIVFLEQAGLPIPAAPWLLAAGAVCGTGETTPTTTIGATVLACLIADSAWFLIGKRGGKRVLHFLCRLTLSADVEQTERSFNRHAMPLVVMGKFVPGVNLVIPALAGASGMGVRRFLLFDSLGSVVYAAFYLLLGTLFSDQVQAILAILHRLGVGSLLLLVALLVIYIAFHHWSRRRPIEQPIKYGKARIQAIKQPISLC